MDSKNLAVSMLDRVRVPKLGKGIHDNIVIVNVDPTEHKSKNGPIKKMLYITYALVDPITRKKKQEAEVSWWMLDPTSEFFFSNLREFCVQLHGILSCYMTEDEAYAALTDDDGLGFKTVQEMENFKWKKKEVDVIQDNLKALFVKAMAPFIGVNGPLIRLKLTTDSHGENVAYSNYGVFTEPMTVTETRLKFTDAELKNHSKAGNTTTAPKSASAALSL